jgi:hypothetical protein
MKVRLLVVLTGTRDGIDWPARGEVVDLPQSEAEHMIAVGQAAPIIEVVESAAAAPAVESAADTTKPTRRAPARKS